MSAYVDRGRVLEIADKVQEMGDSTKLKKAEMIPFLKSLLMALDSRAEPKALVTSVLEDYVPAIPYSVLSRKVWRCAECRGEVWLTDPYCKHCGAKFEGEVVPYGQWHDEAVSDL